MQAPQSVELMQYGTYLHDHFFVNFIKYFSLTVQKI
jgi:hypothetical protein